MVKGLYKGKVIDHGAEYNELDWVCGNLVVEQSTGRTFIVDLERSDENTKLCDIAIEVVPETVGQYTGLCDKTADEMFRELGYEKIKQKNGEYVVYQSGYTDIEIDLKYNVVLKSGDGGIFDLDEIRASASCWMKWGWSEWAAKLLRLER